MFNDFIGEKVNIVISSKGDNILEYCGTLTGEFENSVVLVNATVSIMMLNYQKGIFGGNINKYKENVDKIIINKNYIISCDK